jgi:hypothetical protein
MFDARFYRTSLRSIRVIGVQRFADLDGRLALVERIEVNAIDFVVEQVSTLLYGVTDAGGVDRIRIGLDGFEIREQ